MKDFTAHLETVGEIGFVEEVRSSIVRASGLPRAKPQEAVIFESGELGQVLSLGEKTIEVLIFGKNPVRVGTRITRTNETLRIPVGFELIGHTVDPLGFSLDLLPFNKPEKLSPIDVAPFGIAARRKINRPFETGVTIVDLLVPLGKGQRELIIGDRKTGKTSFLLQTILTQARHGIICIYAAIGKRRSDVKKIEEFFKEHEIDKQSVIIASSAQDSPGVIFLTPFTAMTIAEYFRDEGKDVLIILDDLTTHAKFYREIALLGRRFPGRNSYPADIFSLHAKLLERAGNFVSKTGEQSITCLPVVETVQGELTGYLATNIMAMTDGHIFFDNDLFYKGRRPAINPFLSVTRVGHQTRSQLCRDIKREVMVLLTLFEKMQRFVHFGAEVSEGMKLSLSMGDKIVKFLDQSPQTVLPLNVQILLFALLWGGLLGQKSPLEIREKLEDVTLRQKIDQRIEKATSFNKFLGNIRDIAAELV